MREVARNILLTVSIIMLTLATYVGGIHVVELMTDASATEMVQPRNGCPLDSVRYESPTFGCDCYRVTDRISGESWWLVRMYDPAEWVVMPIGDGKWAPEDTSR